MGSRAPNHYICRVATRHCAIIRKTVSLICPDGANSATFDIIGERFWRNHSISLRAPSRMNGKNISSGHKNSAASSDVLGSR